LEGLNKAILGDPVSAENVRIWKYYYGKFIIVDNILLSF